MIADENARLSATGQVHAADTLRLQGSVVSIGSFDGVHKGHQALLRELSRAASERGLSSVVYTFDPPPKVVFGGVMQLTDGPEKLRRLSHFEIDHIVMAHFDQAYASRPAEDFMAELARLSPREIWVGADFRFGAKRTGDVAMLQTAFKTRILDEFACEGGERISSTRLRACFKHGRLDEARTLHGWPETAPWAHTYDTCK